MSKFQAGDIIQYPNGRQNYLIAIPGQDGLWVNACNPSWIDRGLRSFCEECYPFGGSEDCLLYTSVRLHLTVFYLCLYLVLVCPRGQLHLPSGAFAFALQGNSIRPQGQFHLPYRANGARPAHIARHPCLSTHTTPSGPCLLYPSRCVSETGPADRGAVPRARAVERF